MDNKQRPKGNPTFKNYEAAAKDRKIAALRKKPEKEIEDAVIKLQKSYSDKQSARTCAQLESNKLLETSHINEKIIMELELDEENEVYLGNEICKTVEDEWHNLRLQISALNVLHDEKREDFQALNIRELENLICMTKSRIIDEFKRQRKLVKELEKQNNKFKRENINKNKEEEWERSLADMFQELDESYELFTNKTYTSIQIFYTVQLYRYMECHNIHVRKMLLELKRNREILKDYFNDILERDIAVICDMQARVNYIIGGPTKVRNIKDLRKMKKKEQELKNKVQEVRINMDLLLRRLDSFHRAVQQIHTTQEWCRLAMQKVCKMKREILAPLLRYSEMDKTNLLRQFEEFENINKGNDADSLQKKMKWLSQKLISTVEQMDKIFRNEECIRDISFFSKLLEKFKVRIHFKNEKMKRLEKSLSKLIMASKSLQELFIELNRDDSSMLSNITIVHETNSSRLHEEEQRDCPEISQPDEFMNQDNSNLEKTDNQSTDSDDSVYARKLRRDYFEAVYEHISEANEDKNVPIQKMCHYERECRNN